MEFLDPIYGQITFDNTEQWAVDIINSPEFQRLYNLKQLGLSYKIYPSAMHTRFSHCLGTFVLAQRFFARPEISNLLTLTQQNTIKAAALLHDIGHGAHSHAFELYTRAVNKEFSHEKMGQMLINDETSQIHKILVKYDLDPAKVSVFLLGTAPDDFPQWTKNIISGEVDFDRIDYLLHDYYFAISHDYPANLLTLVDKMHVNPDLDVLYFDQADISLVDAFLQFRYQEHKNIYTAFATKRRHQLVVDMLKILRDRYNQKQPIVDKYNLFHIYKPLFTDGIFQWTDYIQVTDCTFNMFLESVSTTTPELTHLYEKLQCGNNVTEKLTYKTTVTFYHKDRPIWIKLKHHIYAKYEQVSELFTTKEEN